MISFIVYGDPMGKQRPKFSTFNGYVKTYTPQDTQNYESKVISAYKEQCNVDLIEPNVMLVAKIKAYFKIPKGCYAYHKKTNTNDLTTKGIDMVNGKIKPTKKPDCDNIAKIVLDALNGIAYYDDSQVVELSVYKLYSESPRVEVEIYEI